MTHATPLSPGPPVRVQRMPAMPGARRKPPSPLRLLGETKWLVYLAVLILLLKNPCAVYLTFHSAYKLMYFAATIAILLDYCVVRARGGHIRPGRVPGARLYGFFIYLSLAVLLVDAAIAQKVDLEKTVQFVMNIGQFFLILYAAMRFGPPLRLIEGVYRTAVVLAALSLVMVLGNYAGAFPFPGMQIRLANSEEAIFFYFPFGFAHSPLPANLAAYRSYSYFTEPAYFAMLLIPFVLYGLMRARATRKLRHVFCAGLLGTAALFTFSVAGTAAAWLTLFSICLFGVVGRPSARARYAAGLLLILGLTASAALTWATLEGGDDPRLRRAFLAVEDRQFQWSVGMNYAVQHIFGEGIGYATREQVYWRAVKRRDLYGEFTNILECVSYLGLVYLGPLLILLIGIGRYIVAGFFSSSPAMRVLAAMMWFLMIYNASVQIFFTAYFSLMLAAYLLFLMQREDAQRGEPRFAGGRNAVRLHHGLAGAPGEYERLPTTALSRTPC